MTVTTWTYVTMLNVKITHRFKYYNAWTAFWFTDGSSVIIPCTIPRDNVPGYIKAKKWG